MDPRAGSVRRCAPGERATALPRPPTTGRAPTHADAAANRSNDYKPENRPRRPLSSICTGAGRRPSPTPSAAPDRSGVNAADIRTRASARPPVNGSAEGPRDASANRPSGRRHAARPRSSVSSRRLHGAHNSAIAGGHGHAVGATIATLAKGSRHVVDDTRVLAVERNRPAVATVGGEVTRILLVVVACRWRRNRSPADAKRSLATVANVQVRDPP